jgi:hypothetical protein
VRHFAQAHEQPGFDRILVSADFADGQLSESAQQDLKDLADAVIKLKEVAPTPGTFLGPKPLAARRT